MCVDVDYTSALELRVLVSGQEHTLLRIKLIKIFTEILTEMIFVIYGYLGSWQNFYNIGQKLLNFKTFSNTVYIYKDTCVHI